MLTLLTDRWSYATVRKTYLLLREPHLQCSASGELLNGLCLWTGLPVAPGSPTLDIVAFGSSPSVEDDQLTKREGTLLLASDGKQTGWMEEKETGVTLKGKLMREMLMWRW